MTGVVVVVDVDVRSFRLHIHLHLCPRLQSSSSFSQFKRRGRISDCFFFPRILSQKENTLRCRQSTPSRYPSSVLVFSSSLYPPLPPPLPPVPVQQHVGLRWYVTLILPPATTATNNIRKALTCRGPFALELITSHLSLSSFPAGALFKPILRPPCLGTTCN